MTQPRPAPEGGTTGNGDARSATGKGGKSHGGQSVGGNGSGGTGFGGQSNRWTSSGGLVETALGGRSQGGNGPGDPTDAVSKWVGGRAVQGGADLGRGDLDPIGTNLGGLGHGGLGNRSAGAGGRTFEWGSAGRAGAQGEAGNAGGPSATSRKDSSSDCGGFGRVQARMDVQVAANPSELDYCDAAVVSFMCNDGVPGLKLQVMRIVQECCSVVTGKLSSTKDGRVLTLSTIGEGCNCLCTYDVELWQPDLPCEDMQLTVIGLDYFSDVARVIELPLSAGIGSVIAIDEPSSSCGVPGYEPTTADIVKALAGKTQVFNATRRWDHLPGTESLPDIAFDVLEQPQSFALQFSADAASVSVTTPKGETIAGNRREGTALAYDLSYPAGGRLELGLNSEQYSAKLVEFGVGTSVIDAYAGHLASRR